MRKLLILLSCALATSPVDLTAQRRPNFTGSWILDDAPASVPADIPLRLVVNQVIQDGADVASAQRLVVVEYGTSWVRQNSYEIGIAATSPNLSVIRAQWHGDYLYIEEGKPLPSGALRTQRREAWRFDDGGRLIIGFHRSDRAEDGINSSLTYAYRRELLAGTLPTK